MLGGNLRARIVRHLMPRNLAFGLALAAALPGCSQPAARPKPGYAEVAIHVTSDGFVPKLAVAPRGQPVTLVFTRDVDQTCATQVVVESRTWDLPLHRAVRVDLDRGIADTLRYVCGMGMERGAVAAQ